MSYTRKFKSHRINKFALFTKRGEFQEVSGSTHIHCLLLIQWRHLFASLQLAPKSKTLKVQLESEGFKVKEVSCNTLMKEYPMLLVRK